MCAADIHDRRASPLGMPDSCPGPGRPVAGIINAIMAEFVVEYTLPARTP